MKQIIFILLYCMLLMLSYTVKAEYTGDTTRLKSNKTTYRYQPIVIKTSPTAFLWGGLFPLTSEYRLMAEITSGRTHSEQVSISVLDKNIFLKIIEDVSHIPNKYTFKVKGWRLQYAHKFYWISRKKFAPYGFYLAPLFSYTNARVSIGLNNYYKKNYIGFKFFSADAIMGVQVGKMRKLTFDLYWGMGYKNIIIENHSPNTMNGYNIKELKKLYGSSVNIAFGINLGYSL